MNMDIGLLHGIWTALLATTFLAIALWAFFIVPRAQIDAAARIPLDDERESANPEHEHG